MNEIKVCEDCLIKQKVKSLHFDGTEQSIKLLQQLYKNSNDKINMNTLHTKINQWVVKYPDGKIIWRKDCCFDINYKVLK